MTGFHDRSLVIFEGEHFMRCQVFTNEEKSKQTRPQKLPRNELDRLSPRASEKLFLGDVVCS